MVGREVRSEVLAVGPSLDIELRCPNTNWVRRAMMRINWNRVSRESKGSYNSVQELKKKREESERERELAFMRPLYLWDLYLPTYIDDPMHSILTYNS